MAGTKKFWYERQNGPSLITLLAIGPAPEKTLKKLKCLFHATNDICKVTNRKYYVTCNDPKTEFPFTLPDDAVAKQNMRISFQLSIKATFLGQMFDAISEVSLGNMTLRDPRLWYYLLAAGHNEFGKTTAWFNRSLMARMHVNAETAAEIALNTEYYESTIKELAQKELDSVNTGKPFDLIRRYIQTRGQRDKDLRSENEKLKQALQPVTAKRITVKLLKKRRVWYCFDSFFERIQFDEFKDKSGVYYLFVCSHNRGPTRLFAQLSPFSKVTILVHILNCEEQSSLYYYSPYIERLVANFLKIFSEEIELILLDETGIIETKKSEIESHFKSIRSRREEIQNRIESLRDSIDKLSDELKARKQLPLNNLQRQLLSVIPELELLEQRLIAAHTLNSVISLLEETNEFTDKIMFLQDSVQENIVDVLSGLPTGASGGDLSSNPSNPLGGSSSGISGGDSGGDLGDSSSVF